ncbi:MAG: 50S ribosomal protein L30 [Deltaproteobacteria bacterium]|nr:50S ribosomal protein L30 [Deltaproteobacteria bacterium]
MAKKLKVTQVRSGISRPETQRVVLKGLGLGRPNHSRVLEDSAAIRGMIRKVQHLVRVEAVE